MWAKIKGNVVVGWLVTALVIVALAGGVILVARSVLSMAGTSLVEATDKGAHAVGNVAKIPAYGYRGHHEVLGLRMCWYPEVRWGSGCKVSPNATPNDSSRPQDDGSSDPNFCPSFTEYVTSYLPEEGACKLETFGPVTTIVVPDGWKADYWTTASTEAKAVAGEEITTSTATFRKVK